MRKLDVGALAEALGSRYPPPYDEPCRTRARKRLGDAATLTQFGVNLLRVSPGGWSSQRHWHTAEDEFIMVLAGSVVLVTDAGEETLHAGDCAGFKAGAADAHHLQNRSDEDAMILEVGARRPDDDEVFYPDIDLRITQGRHYVHQDGRPYEDRKPSEPK